MPVLATRIAAVLAALGLAAGAWLAGDGAGARAAVGQATGPLVATAPGDAALLVARNLAPGDARSGEVTVTNAGDASGAFALNAADLADAGAPLSGVLELAVDDVTAGRPVYAGPLTGLGTVTLGMLAQGEAHRYRFTVLFPGGRPDAVENAYQGASTTVTFVWSATGAATSGSGPSAPSGATAGTPAAPVTAAGTGRTPHSAIGAAYRQTGAHGRVTTWVSCEATCRIALGGTAAFDARKLRLRTVHGTLRASGRLHMLVTLPRAARQAVSRGRQVTVRLRAKATMGSRVVVTRRTILVARAR
jgi:hypothetical protein